MDNKADMRSKGRNKPPPVRVGEANNMSKLTADDVRAIRKRLEKPRWGDISAIAKEYGVVVQTVLRVRDRKTWRHV